MERFCRKALLIFASLYTSKAMTKKVHPIFKAALFCMAFTALYVLLSLLKSALFRETGNLAHALIGIFVALLVTWAFLKADKRSFRSIGLFLERPTISRFLMGIGLGIVLMAGMTAAVIFFSGFSLSRNPESDLLKFLMGSLPLLPLAFMEELAFRGYPFETLREKTGLRSSIYISALLFGLYHLANGWTLQNALLGAGVWGIIFGLAAHRSRGIALPTGLHYAANLTTSAFGISSGSYHLWVLKASDGGSLANYQGSMLETLLPQVGLLLVGVVGVEWLRGRRT